jgi:protein-L-isoaspartate(D-aspartate) O-methyltransferase
VTNTNFTGIGMTSQRTRNRLLERLREQGITNERVLDIIGSTPRHIFIDEALAHRAYEDTALPIGHSQTISQPYMVARMTQELLSEGPLKNVLEIGTGSGYQTSVLSQLVKQVHSVERIKPLQDKARERLKLLSLNNVKLKYADGGMGWPSQGPFDGIIVTAAPPRIPQDLVDQLAEGGRMIIPVGTENQELRLLVKQDGKIIEKSLTAVLFVPLVSGVKA